MGFSIFNLFKAGLLLTNSGLILNRKRFLAKYGLDNVNNMGYDPSEKPLQVQLIGFLHAIEYLRVPVIGLNLVTVLFEVVLGGT